MTDNPMNDEVAVDRHEETVSTQHAGFAATEKTTRDYAAERRLGTAQLVRIIWAGLGGLEILLGLRVLLLLIGANPENGFTQFIQAITLIPAAPFAGITPAWFSGNIVFEVSTIIAMMVYWLAAWIFVRVIPIAMDRQSKGTFTRTTSEQDSDGIGSNRTTQTTRRG
jgi:hypothetical protein